MSSENNTPNTDNTDTPTPAEIEAARAACQAWMERAFAYAYGRREHPAGPSPRFRPEVEAVFAKEREAELARHEAVCQEVIEGGGRQRYSWATMRDRFRMPNGTYVVVMDGRRSYEP